MSKFFNQPKGLYILFLTEMWERFSYYGMRALLVLYMTQYLLLDPERARQVFGYTELETLLISVFGEMNIQQMSSQIYGIYTGLVYFTPLFGGVLADRFLGRHKTVYVGGVLMAIGHFLMASEQCFLIALLFLILGNGAFKPNISTQVGDLYEEGDPRRDGAFTIFYMGINLGAFFSPLVCGTLGQKVGWHYGFGAAGIGMILGLIIYYFGSHHIPKRQVLQKDIVDKVPLSRSDWQRIGVIVLCCALNIVFWAIFEQQGNTLQLWSEEKTDWNFFGVDVPSTFYQSLNPLYIFIFAPVLTSFWLWQGKKQPSSVTKMGIGCMLAGFAYIFMIIAARVVGDVPGEKGSLFWLAATTWIFSIGELYLSPIGLAFVARVSPPQVVSTMMGFWFLSSFFGNYATGYLGTFYSVMSKDMFFGLLTVLGVVTGLLFFLLSKPVNRVVAKHFE